MFHRRPRRPAERHCFTEGKWSNVPVFERAGVGRTATAGPALLLDYGSTTLIPRRLDSAP